MMPSLERLAREISAVRISTGAKRRSKSVETDGRYVALGYEPLDPREGLAARGMRTIQHRCSKIRVFRGQVRSDLNSTSLMSG
jgi:hypothetical protein